MNEANLINLDVLYSDYRAERDESYLEAFSFSRNASQGGKPATRIVAGELAPNGTLVYGLFDAVDIRSEARHDELRTRFSSYTLSATHELSPRWTLSELAGYSRSDFNNPVQTTITSIAPTRDGSSWDFRGTRLPAFDYGFDVADPANWAFGTFPGGSSEIRIRPQGVDNTFLVGKIDLAFAATDSFKLKFGVDYKEYDFVSFESRRASETTVPALPAGTTIADLSTGIHGFGAGLDVPEEPRRAGLIPDLDAFARTFDIYGNSGMFALGSINNAAARGNNRSVTEERPWRLSTGGFLRSTRAIPLRGDIGVRYAHTEQTSQGYLPAGGAPVLLTEVHEYSDVLPSLNLVAEFTPDFLLRFAAAKVMTRPALGQVTPGGTTSLVGNLGVGDGQSVPRSDTRQHLRSCGGVVLR